MAVAATQEPYSMRSGYESDLLRMWAAYTLALRRFSRSKFMIGNLILAAVPLMMVIPTVVFAREIYSDEASFETVHLIYEGLLRVIFLHLSVFFAACTIGFSVMRQDKEDQTLHYLFLQPIARWMVIVGKFGAYLTLTSGAIITSLWITYLAMAVPVEGVSATVKDLFSDGRLWILARESGILALGLLIYGSVALAVGSVFRSAFYALLLLLWETALLPFLPATLKFWTASHYLHSLFPQRLADQRGLLELLGEPASVGLSLTVLLGVSAVLLAGSIAIFRTKECLYEDN